MCKHCQQCVVLHVLAFHMTGVSELARACFFPSGLPVTCPECKIARSVCVGVMCEKYIILLCVRLMFERCVKIPSYDFILVCVFLFVFCTT